MWIIFPKSGTMTSFSKLPFSCYDVGHTWTPFCRNAAIDIGFSCFQEGLKIYASIYTVRCMPVRLFFLMISDSNLCLRIYSLHVCLPDLIKAELRQRFLAFCGHLFSLDWMDIFIYGVFVLAGFYYFIYYILVIFSPEFVNVNSIYICSIQ